MSDDGLAARLAYRAGILLMDLRRSQLLFGKPLAVTGDAVANTLLMAALAVGRPGQPVLSEEAPDDRSRLGQRAVWIVDPLDGSREFGEGRSDFAVHVALAVDGVAVCGAVSLPAFGATYSTLEPPVRGAVPDRPLRVVVSRSRPPVWTEAVAGPLGAEVVAMGSMGAKAMAVVRGDADVYVHAGGHHEWDAAAPAAVAHRAGLQVSDLHGAPLRFNRSDVVQAGLVICRPELASRVLELLAGVVGRDD